MSTKEATRAHASMLIIAFECSAELMASRPPWQWLLRSARRGRPPRTGSARARYRRSCGDGLGITLDAQACEAVQGNEVPKLIHVVAFRADVGEVVFGGNREHRKPAELSFGLKP